MNHRLRWMLMICAWSALLGMGGWSAVHADESLIQISGRYPHLTFYNSSQEVGVGAVVMWQDKLYVVTYSPHAPRGNSDDKLYVIDSDLNKTAFEGSVGGTPANRMIHRESNQLFIGPYVVDAKGDIRTIPMGSRPDAAEDNRIFGRLTATTRHLHDPANKIYHIDMEGIIYEVDVHTLDVNLLYTRAVPGWHGKGGYTGQGRVVIANNGEWVAGTMNPFQPFDYQIDPRPADAEGVCPACRTTRCEASVTYPENAGILAEWDGRDWRAIKRRQFTEVTGPGGIHGAPDDDAPVWSTGWDKRSLFLMVLDEGRWHKFRLPKADYSYDGHHGWHTEWPRIRQVAAAQGDAPARLLMNMHGGLFDFPATLRATDTSGLRPIGSYLKIISDMEAWHDGRIVFACNETSRFNNPLVGRSQSNLWFATWQRLHELGAPAGWGGVWMHDVVKADTPSAPFLIKGYEQRVLHLAHDADETVTFTLETDETGRGDWQTYARVEVEASGYAYRIIDEKVQAQWMRVRSDRDLADATAYFHFGPSGGAVTDAAMFAALAGIADEGPYFRGMIRPRGDDMTSLHMLARTVDAQGEVGPARHYEIDKDMALRDASEDEKGAAWLAEHGAFTEGGTSVGPDKALHVTFDDASVIVTRGEERFRLPKGHEGFDRPCAGGPVRHVREVVSERALLNAHGIFYMLPRQNSGGVRAMKPVTTHNKRITDWCTWAGMLVMTGTRSEAASGEHHRRDGEGEAGLWLGDVDDLWRMGKPRGTGGPWRNTAVQAQEASDPYLMAGFDRKQVHLSHDADTPIAVTLEVDVFGAVDTPVSYFPYKRIVVPVGQTVEYVFPPGYSAQWIRLHSDTAATITATFIYE